MRAVRGGHGQDPGLQELALAGACGAAEQRVRPVHPQVQGVRLTRCLADDGAQRAGAARSRRRGRWAGEDRAALLPAFEHDGGLLGDARVVQLEPGDGPGQVTVVVEHRAGVDQRRQRPAEGQRGAVVDGVHGDVGDGRAGDAVADAGQPGAAHVDVRGARGGQVFGPRCEPDAVDADCGPVPAELDQAGAVGGGAAVDQDEHGDQAALFGGLAVGGLAVGARPGQLFELAEQGGGLGPGHQVRAGQRTVRGGGVRQPLQPVPVGPRAGPAEGGEHDLGRGVQRGQLAQDGAGHVERGAGFPGDADRPVRGEREGERHVVDDPVPGQHLVQRGLGGRCGPAAGLDGEAQLRVQRRSPHPHVEEPRHVRPSAPQQRGPLGGGGQAARRGRMLGVAGLSLLRLGSEGRLVQRGDLAAHVGQGAAAAAGRGPAALDDVRQHDHRAQRHEDQRRGAAGDRVQDAAEQERGEHGQDRETLVVERLRELRAGERRAGVAGGDDRGAVERGRRGVGCGADLGGELDPQHRVAQPQPVPGGPRAARHGLVVQDQAVGRAQVEDLGRSGGEEDPDMAAGHQVVREPKVAACRAADGLVARRQRHAPPAVRPLEDGDHSDRPGGRVVVAGAGRADGDAGAGLEPAVDQREVGVQRDAPGVDHGQRAAAADRLRTRRIPGGQGVGDVTDRGVGVRGEGQVDRAGLPLQGELDLHRCVPPAQRLAGFTATQARRQRARFAITP